MGEFLSSLLCMGLPLLLIIYGVRTYRKNKKKKKDPTPITNPVNTEPKNPVKVIQEGQYEEGVGYEFETGAAIKIYRDEFEETKSMELITLDGISSATKLEIHNDKWIHLQIGFRSEGDENFILFSAYQKDYKFYKNDIISFLFEDSSVQKLDLIENGYKIEKDSDGVLNETRALLSEVELTKLSSKEIKKIRFNSAKEKYPIEWELEEYQREKLKNTAASYFHALKEFY